VKAKGRSWKKVQCISLNSHHYIFKMKVLAFQLLCVTAAALPSLVAGNNDEPVEYGADVSFPMQHWEVSTNYPWLEHNMDPSLPVPDKYKDMVPQPLGDRQSVYDEYYQGCLDTFQKKGKRCQQNELDRVAMTLRQPQSMQNYVSLIRLLQRKYILRRMKKLLLGGLDRFILQT